MQTSKDLKDLDVQLKKTVISAEKFRRGTSADSSKNLSSIHKNISSLAGHTRKLVIRVSEIEKKSNINSIKITSLKSISKTQSSRISGADIGSKLPGGSSKNVEKDISAISKSVASIAEILLGRKKLSVKQANLERRKKEKEKRALAESKLEKAFQGIAKTAQKIIQPVKSILDRILQFIGTIIFGRILVKIIRWMGNPQNREKLNSVIRFFKDWAPQLLSLYIVFGTSLGRFARGLVGLLIKSTIKIGALAAKLAVKAGIGRAGGKLSKIGNFLGGRKGKLLATGLETAFAVGSTVAISNTLQGDSGGRGTTEIQNFNGGGYVKPRFPSFSGGGFNFKGMMGGASMGAMFGPLGMLLGGALGGKSNGFVSGEKGVDKVPAMLSDGEFVMSRGAVDKYGVGTLEAMNAAGGGTNVPKIVSGTTYAAGGGYIGDARKALIDINNWLYSQGVRPHDPRTWAGEGGKFATGVMSGLSRNLSGLNQNLTQKANQLANTTGQYFSSGNLERDVSKIMQTGSQFGAGLYQQAYDVGNAALTNIQSGNALKSVKEMPTKAAGGVLDLIKDVGSSKTYENLSSQSNKIQDKQISLSDKFIKNLPDGPFKEIADKGLIPIPTGDAKMMRNLTFVKSMLGPLGKPFKLLSNKEVDKMRQMTIDKTIGKSGGLIVDEKTGQVKMNWNQEDINKGAQGGGAYTDDLGPGGKEFNSILGRFHAKTEGDGNILYTDDRYNFNKTVAEYADLAKGKIMQGSISDAGYYALAGLGRFAQDIGWLNQRALGSRIKIGEIDRNTLDPKTGKKKTPTQMQADFAKIKQQEAIAARKKANQEKLEAKRPWWDKAGWFGGASAEMKRQAEREKSAQIKKDPPKVPSITPSPKPKPKVTVVKSSSKRSRYSQGANAAPKTPNFGATSPASTANRKQRQKLFGIF